MPEPRIAPVPAEERDAEFTELLTGAGPGAERFNLFTTLARHPGLFRRWIAFSGKLLLGAELPARDRELVILRTLWLVQARNEWYQHLRIAARCGVGTEDVDRIIEGPDAAGWTPLERALILVADELHATGRIGNETWATCAAAYDERQLIELPFLAGQYHLVGFVCNALELDPDHSTLPGPMRNPER